MSRLTQAHISICHQIRIAKNKSTEFINVDTHNSFNMVTHDVNTANDNCYHAIIIHSSIYWYLQGCPPLQVYSTVLLHACIIHVNSIFNLNLRQPTNRDSNPDLWPKAAMLTSELHSIDIFIFNTIWKIEKYEKFESYWSNKMISANNASHLVFLAKPNNNVPHLCFEQVQWMSEIRTSLVFGHFTLVPLL